MGEPQEGAEERRAVRLEQLKAMSSEEFAAEVRRHQSATWQTRRVAGHLDKHGRDLARVLGCSLSERELIQLSRGILELPDRVFTGINAPTNQIEYAFVRDLGGADIIVVMTRAGALRSMFPSVLEHWLRRRSDLVEVTENVRELGKGP